jgi:hypothetical protein
VFGQVACIAERVAVGVELAEFETEDSCRTRLRARPTASVGEELAAPGEVVLAVGSAVGVHVSARDGPGSVVARRGVLGGEGEEAPAAAEASPSAHAAEDAAIGDRGLAHSAVARLVVGP